MKPINIIPLIIIMLYCNISATAHNSFRLADRDGQLKSIRENIITNKPITIHLNTGRSPISGLAITGRITIKEKDYLVRIILLDREKHEHLVLESYNAINDKQDYSFNGYCEETSLLNAIYPDSIRVYVHNAQVIISDIQFRESSNNPSDRQSFINSHKKIHEEQMRWKVNRINNYNHSKKKLWRAGITTLSKKSYEEKKKILGFSDDSSTGGVEFYTEGIFEIGDTEESNNTPQLRNDFFIDEFDWRLRHGKNWITPNRHQGNSGYCHFFTCVACTEALTNLYYNNLMNLDLSEQELACCSGISNPYSGVPYSTYYLKKPLDYLVANGVCDENAYPFEDNPLATCRSSEITPNELITIGGYENVDKNNEDSLKKALIEHGPLVSGVHYWGYNPNGSTWNKNHAMLIVGYGNLEVGDTIYHWINSDGFKDGRYVVTPDDPRVGRTYWIYKNSYGLSEDSARLGYMYIIHYDYSQSMNYTYYCKPPITSMNHSDDEIICEDTDGDGYYYWGIGGKPSWSPEWIPEIKDGDDSNYSRGKLFLDAPNVIGDLEILNPDDSPDIQISGTTTFNSRQYIYSHITITSNAVLTVQDILNLFGRVTITIESGGELIIDGGVITNAVIDFETGGKLTIKNDGKLIMRTNSFFDAPVGALVEIESGEICRSSDF